MANYQKDSLSCRLFQNNLYILKGCKLSPNVESGLLLSELANLNEAQYMFIFFHTISMKQVGG